ncbi:hypothetical protein ILUMI_16857, partial [Ignelater luminosus]
VHVSSSKMCRWETNKLFQEGFDTLLHAIDPSWHLRRRRMNSLSVTKLKNTKTRRRNTTVKTESDYGPAAAKPDINQGELPRKSFALLEKLHQDEVDKIESNTRGQHNNVKYLEMR